MDEGPHGLGSNFGRLLCLSLCLCGCSAQSPTQIVLAIHTDLEMPAVVDGLRIEASHGDQSFVRGYPLGSQPGQFELPATIALDAPPAPRGDLHLTVTGLLGDRKIVRREAQLGWISGRRLLLRINLQSRCRLEAIRCSAVQTCIDGLCASIEIDENTLPTYNDDAAFAPAADAGVTGDDAVGDAADNPADASAEAKAICRSPWCWEHPLPQGSNLHGVWSPDGNQTLFVVGVDGLVMHFDGQRWRRQDSNTRAQLFSIWGPKTMFMPWDYPAPCSALTAAPGVASTPAPLITCVTFTGSSSLRGPTLSPWEMGGP